MKEDTRENEPEVDIELTGEDNMDEPLMEDVEATSHSKIKSLQAKLKACESEKTKYQDDLQRAKADFLNARKRIEDEREREKEKLIIKHIEKLLPLYDSFSMAMSNQEAWNAVGEEWRKGVESIYTQLQRLLNSYGVTEVDPTGQEFNPMEHEAMAEQPVSEEKDNHMIVSVIQKGFVRTIDGKTELIRPARVTVGVLKN